MKNTDKIKEKTSKKVSSNNKNKNTKTVKKEIENKELKKKILDVELEIEKEEEKNNKKKKWLLLLLLLFLFVLISLGLTYSINEKFRDKVQENIINTLKIDTPTRPEIDGGSREWSKKQVIKVVKDAKSYSGINYYEYCVSSDKDFSDCEWKKTETKNMVSSTTGKYFVVFRGVSNNGKVGSNSNIEETWIDNEGPTITKLSIDNTKKGIKVSVGAEDIHSGVDSYYYKLDNGEYKKVKSVFDIKLDDEKEYEITIKVVDKLGNSKEVSKKFVYDLEDEDKVCRLNCDTDGDGECDLNCDTDGDGECDLYCDTDGDGDCDLNCDTDGEGKCDLNCDTDGDGDCDLNCDTDGDGECDLNCDTNGDGECDLNCDTNGDGECDLNCDDKDNTDDDKDDEDDTTGKEPKPSASPKPTPDDGEEILVPEINLDKVPLEFFYGESYELPSFVDFKGDTGTVSCIVEGVEYTDTNTLKIGKHLIVCTATSSKNVKAMVEKEVEVKANVGPDEVWDGWIRLNLYYPENSTNWQWRIGKEGEIRTGYDNTDWQDYTGPILVKLEDVDDVYIRYDLDGETVVVPPNGRVLVDIVPEAFTLEKNEKTKVIINYEKNAETKEYKVNDGDWQEYKGSFEVGVNTIIEARATKSEKVYDSNGEYVYTSKRTGTDSVFISQVVEIGGTAGGTAGGIPYGPTSGPGGITVTSPGPGSKPSTYLAGPEIISNTNEEIVEVAKITVKPQQPAEKVYYSVNNGSYSEYTGSFEVANNTLVKAYYIRLSDGKVSDVSYYHVNNIKKNNLPYVRINTSPSNYLSEDVDSVEVSISGSDYDTLEYSLDGVVYSNYTTPLTITESSTVYARGTNQYGKTIERKTIVTVTSPTPVEELDVSIHLNPSSENVKGLVNKTTVSINYDSRATKKYYKLGSSSEWKEYTGEFEVTQNTTVYAYCTKENGKGDASKQVSFLTTGISDPIINADTKTKAPQVKVSITYDKSADITRYQIGDGPLLDYNGPFYVYENTTIRAYNKNILGYEAESSLTINNIVPNPDYVIIDMDQYFIIRLNYPTDSKEESREYKWKPDGVWKVYDPQGILLIKPEYKDEFDLESVDGIRVKDSNGNYIIFTDHYYLIDVPFSELMENLFMRWDKATIKAPTIAVNTEEATKEVEVGIIYPNSLVDKYYKVVGPDGEDTGWKKYTGPFKVNENESVVYAKGYTRTGSMSQVASKKITNIDEVAPEINVIGDLTTPKQRVTLNVKVTDNFGAGNIEKVKWAKGEKDASYFKDKGTKISNNGTFTVEENGKYTVYAVDKVGHETVKVIEVTNIDKNAPDIIIDVLTEKYGTEAEVSIDYGDSKTKEYRIGESSTTYNTYTKNIIIKSNDVLNLANEDGSLTIYARGIDEAGNVTEVSEKIYVLDLDAPATPIIHSTVGYPILTEYGVKLGQDNYIVFDTTRDDITNYYSVDNGKTWEIYTGPFEIKSGTIMAKSVKNISGLTISTSKKIVMPADALGPEAYDGSDTSATSFTSTAKIYVSEELWGRNISYLSNSGTVGGDYSRATYITAIGENEEVLNEILTFSSNQQYTIPQNTKYIKFTSRYSYWLTVYELKIHNYPIINAVNYYPTLKDYGVDAAYNEVTINYFQTSVQRLYKINDGNWKEYQNKPIRLEIGDTIQTKGIDKYGTETNIITYESKLVSDALGPNAYDGSDSSTTVFTSNVKLYVSEEMWGSRINYISNSGTVGGDYGRATYITAIGENGETLNEILTHNGSQYYTIPQNTKYIKFTSRYSYGLTVYELKIDNYPIINGVKHYPMLTENGVEHGYNEVTIDYFKTLVQRLYRINSGDWQEYQDKPIKLKLGDTIQAKGIDKYNKETTVPSYTSSAISDALESTAYDGNLSSSVWLKERTFVIDVSEGMQNKIFNIRFRFGYVDAVLSDGTTKRIISHQGWEDNKSATIPVNTIKLKIIGMGTGTYPYVYEIWPSTTPTITQTNIYPNLTSSGLNDSLIEVKINYLSHLSQKLYSLDNGTTWQEYTKAFKVNGGDVIKAKAIDENGTASAITTYTVKAISDAISSKAFDNNQETIYTVAANTSNSFTIDNDIIGKKMRFYFTNTPATDGSIKVYDKSNTLLKTVTLTSQVTVIEIPEGAYKVTVTSGSSALNISEINLRPVIEKTKTKNPIITINDVNWGVSKTIEITYPEGYTNEYSLDGGETWTEYTSEFTITESSVVIARSIDANGEVVASSSYTITKIDTTNPTVTIEIPDEITVGDEYSLPTSYTVDEDKSGGNVICKIGEDEVNNTSSLDLGTYEIVCTVTTGVGNSTSVVKNVTVKDVLVDITLELDDKILLGASNNLPTTVTGGTALCKVGDTTVTNTSELEVGLHNIICTVTSSKGTVKEISKQIEIYEETSTEEETESEGESNETVTE